MSDYNAGELFHMSRKDVGITATQNEDGTATVEWTDYVANDWERQFPSPSHALAWVAFLLHCEERDWAVVEGSGDFAPKVEAFFAETARYEKGTSK